MSLLHRGVKSMSDIPHEGHETARDQGGPVPKFLILVYLTIAAFFVYYMVMHLKFGPQSPTGF